MISGIKFIRNLLLYFAVFLLFPISINAKMTIDTVEKGTVSDLVYGVGWNGIANQAPSKNAVYDKMETLGAAAAPVGAKYIVQQLDATLTGEQATGALATGLLKNTTATGVLSIGIEGTDYYGPAGTDVAVADGGTGVSTLADGGLVIGNAGNDVEVIAAGTLTQILVGGGAGTAPSWGADIPTAVTIGTKYIYRAAGTDVAVTDGGTGASTAANAFTALKQNATDAATGVVELATDEETVTGASDAVVCTPGNITAKLAAPGAIGGTTPAAINGLFVTIEKSADAVTLTALECSDTLITTRGWDGADDQTFTLPDADTVVGAGLKTKIMMAVTDAAQSFYIDTEGTTTLVYLDGIAGADGHRIWTEFPTIGESIVCHTATLDGTTYDWYCDTINGVWSDKGS